MTNSKTQTPSHHRSRYFIDPAVQGNLMRQVVYHWMWTSVTFTAVVFFCRIGPAWLSGVETPTGQIWYHLAPFMVASVVLFPMVLFSSLRFSHRFAGPMVRIRRGLHDLAQGNAIDHLRFRGRDHWTELADDINEIAAELTRLRNAESSKANCKQQLTAAAPQPVLLVEGGFQPVPASTQT